MSRTFVKEMIRKTAYVLATALLVAGFVAVLLTCAA